MAERVTLKKLAGHLDLSVTTVSRALKEGPEVRPNTIARVKQAASKLGYFPDQRGFNLRTGRTNTIALILYPDPQSAFPAMGYMNFCQGIIRELEGSNMTLSIIPRFPGDEMLAPLKRVVESGLADGLIVGQTRNQDVRLRYLLEKDFPFVSFGRSELFSPHPYFDVAHEEITYHSTIQFLEAGHRRIALVSPPADLNYTSHRRKGFNKAMNEWGVRPEPEWVVDMELSFESGRETMGTFLGMKNPPRAFLSPGVSVTLGMLAALKQAGLAVGRDVCLIAFEGTRYLEFSDPPVSAFHASLDHAGKQLCGLLLRRIQGEKPEDLQLLEQAEYHDRGSC
ncbi:MAG: hypothetical protein CL914_09175 [Deltaproteobacteria bacterium]|nr:hypothetical protein [Deltaproteobacteria bacterium]